MNDKEAFDLWWEWAEKPVDSMLLIDATILEAVMALPPDERRDRAKVNEAARHGLHRGAAARRHCGLVRRSESNRRMKNPPGVNRRALVQSDLLPGRRLNSSMWCSQNSNCNEAYPRQLTIAAGIPPPVR
jgi:hypothetical protein